MTDFASILLCAGISHKCKLEASGTAVEQWVKQAKSEDANEYWTLLAHSSLVSFRDMGFSA